MESGLVRKYDFLKNKYNELLLPTIFMLISDKSCSIIDVIIIGFFLGSTQLSVINMASPLTYITGVFYVLFGQGGNLLALRAQSQLQHDKKNYYFTFSVLGICVFSLIYVLTVFLFMDTILMSFNPPAEIYGLCKQYLLILMFYYPLNCYLLVVSFFIRSDGYPKMPFYAIFIGNVINVLLDIVFLKVFNLGIEYTALASVLGYLVSAIYVSRYLFNKQASFRLISLAKFKIKGIFVTIKEYILNTPEIIGRIFLAFKMSFLTYLCSTYWGIAGLLAFLVYDNSETFVYMFLSGIMKTMSPIVTVLHKEDDFEAVQYVIVRSLKQIVIISVPICAIFFIFPEVLLKLFNIVNPDHAKVVVLAIRLTAFSILGRSLSYLLANYAQAIGENKISTILIFSEEFLFAISCALILTEIIGGVGIWISILIAECSPLLVYIIYITYRQKRKNDKINRLMLQESELIAWTYSRSNGRNELDGESEEILPTLEKRFSDDSIIILNSINELCNNLFENTDIQDIDIAIRQTDNEEVYIAFTSEGASYNPFSNENLMKSENIKRLSKLNCEFDYEEVLRFNRSYLIFKD